MGDDGSADAEACASLLEVGCEESCEISSPGVMLGALEEMKIGLFSVSGAAPAIGSVAIMIAEKAAPGWKEVVNPLGDDDEFVGI